MQPRVLYRTHYQVDEPAFVRVVLGHCSSPTRSEYDEVVAERLVRRLKLDGRELNGAAARYAVDLCHGLGVLSEQNSWTDRGLLLVALTQMGGTATSDFLTLTRPEALGYFEVFLEADGAVFLYLIRLLCRNAALPGAKGDWNSIARDMFVEIYTEYLTLAGTMSDRVRLRQELDRLRSKGFTGKSGAHKMFVHLQSLVRIGLLKREEAGQARHYSLAEDPTRNPSDLPLKLPDLMALERVVSGREWLEVASGTLIAPLTEDASASLLPRLMDAYLRISRFQVDLCPLSTLTDLTRIAAATDGTMVTYDQCLATLTYAQKQHLRRVRFHVDRQGRPAYIKIDPDLAAELKEG